MHDPVPYVIRREADRWVVVPSPVLGGVMVGGFGFGALFSIYIATLFFRRANSTTVLPWIGGVFLLLAGLSAVLAVRAWLTRRTPLSIEPGGRVCYGQRELCAAGTARAVRVGPSRGGDPGDVEVWLELAGGDLVSIPSRYFPGFKSRARARPFAASLARVLGVPVTELY